MIYTDTAVYLSHRLHTDCLKFTVSLIASDTPLNYRRLTRSREYRAQILPRYSWTGVNFTTVSSKNIPFQCATLGSLRMCVDNLRLCLNVGLSWLLGPKWFELRNWGIWRETCLSINIRAISISLQATSLTLLLCLYLLNPAHNLCRKRERFKVRRGTWPIS